MVKMTGIYTGEKHCRTEHEPSRSVLETDAPKDNQGRGESFSPTDLVATALGTCILTTLAIVGEKEGLNLKDSRMSVEKEMTGTPRRIASLKTVIELPAALTQAWRERLETAAHNCPVRKSLHPDVVVPIEFKYSL